MAFPLSIGYFVIREWMLDWFLAFCLLATGRLTASFIYWLTASWLSNGIVLVIEALVYFILRHDEWMQGSKCVGVSCKRFMQIFSTDKYIAPRYFCFYYFIYRRVSFTLITMQVGSYVMLEKFAWEASQ